MTTYRPILLIAACANLLTIAFYFYANGQPGGTHATLPYLVLWIPAVWITALILTLIVIIQKREKLFAGTKIFKTILLLLFCTPLPFYAGYQLIHKNAAYLRLSTAYLHHQGKIYKTEAWYYTPDYRKKFVTKYFIADSLDEAQNGKKAFKMDSTWIYYSKSGDTMKIEKYLQGKLLSEQHFNY
jgi:amino acid permease